MVCMWQEVALLAVLLLIQGFWKLLLGERERMGGGGGRRASGQGEWSAFVCPNPHESAAHCGSFQGTGQRAESGFLIEASLVR